MIHFLTLFLAPEGSAPQATLNPPPALELPAQRRCSPGQALRFMAGVAADAAGFGLLLAGCGFFLQLMQVMMLL